jgi:hypothetical protein
VRAVRCSAPRWQTWHWLVVMNVTEITGCRVWLVSGRHRSPGALTCAKLRVLCAPDSRTELHKGN